MSDFSTFFPGGGGGGGGAIGDYGVKPMASGTNVFTDPNDSSVWFKTGHISTNTSAYPKFTPIFGKANTYSQLAGTAAFASSNTYCGDVQYNSVDDQIVTSQWGNYWFSDNAGMYFLDPANIAGGNWGTTDINTTTVTNPIVRYTFEPVGDGLGNNYVLESNNANNTATSGARHQQRTSNWLQPAIMRIRRVNNSSPGSRQAGYNISSYTPIYISGIPTGPSASSFKQYQMPTAFVATENFFYYSFLQLNPQYDSYLAYYYGDAVFQNYQGSLTEINGRQPNPTTPSQSFARLRTVKLSKAGAYISELTRPFTDASGGGGALIVFTDPTSTGNSFWTLDKNIFQNAIGPSTSTQLAGWPRTSTIMDYSSTMTIRKHSEDGTVIKEAGGLPVSSAILGGSGFASSFWQQAFCTPDGTPHYFSAAALGGNTAQNELPAVAGSSLKTPHNIISLGDVVGDSSPRFSSIPTSSVSTKTGMGINTSNIQIQAGPTALASNPQQLYIRVA